MGLLLLNFFLFIPILVLTQTLIRFITKRVHCICCSTQRKFHCACITLCRAHIKFLEELYFTDCTFHIFSHRRIIFCLKLQPGCLSAFVSSPIKYWGSSKTKAVHSQLQPALPAQSVSKAQINNRKITTLPEHWCWLQLVYSKSI